MDFWHQLVWEMAENTLDGKEKASGVEVICLRKIRGTSGEHKHVMAPKYCGTWLAEENKCGRV